MATDEQITNMRRIASVVLPFGLKLKARMHKLQKRIVRVECPNPEHTETKYVTASLNGRKDHIHFGCEDVGCYYRMIE